VSLKSRLLTLFCCSVLEIAAFTGMPMRPDEIRNLMESLNKSKIAQTDPERTPSGDGQNGDSSST
jgi:hypothetical protein